MVHLFEILIIACLFLASLALVVVGISVFRKPASWFVRSIGVICSLLGIAALFTLIAGFAFQLNPFPALGVQIAIGVGLAGLLFWVAMLAECAIFETNDNQRLVWVVIIIFTGILGAFLYTLARRPIRLEETGR